MPCNVQGRTALSSQAPCGNISKKTGSQRHRQGGSGSCPAQDLPSSSPLRSPGHSFPGKSRQGLSLVSPGWLTPLRPGAPHRQGQSLIHLGPELHCAPPPKHTHMESNQLRLIQSPELSVPTLQKLRKISRAPTPETLDPCSCGSGGYKQSASVLARQSSSQQGPSVPAIYQALSQTWRRAREQNKPQPS